MERHRKETDEPSERSSEHVDERTDDTERPAEPEHSTGTDDHLVGVERFPRKGDDELSG